MTAIEWTDATWNPTTGCTRVSAGCDHCYIERTPPLRMAGRSFDGAGPGSTTGVQLHPDRLDQPLRWRKPRRIFVNSMSDLFHAKVPLDYIADVFAVMGLARQHTFQVLTKRPDRMAHLLKSDQFRDAVGHAGWAFDPDGERIYEYSHPWPFPNVWIGVSVEDQKSADIRIPKLLDTPAAVRFLSCEPLLGPVQLRTEHLYPDACPAGCGCHWPVDADVRECGCDGACTSDEEWLDRPAKIDWVIVGGESGPGARPMHPDWARDLRDQCTADLIPFHFKQWGEYLPVVIEDDAAFAGGRAYKDPRGGRTSATLKLRSPGPLQSGGHRPLKAGDRTTGEWTPDDVCDTSGASHVVMLDGRDRGAPWPGWQLDQPTAAVMRRVGKKRAGRELEGRTWDEQPLAVDA